MTTAELIASLPNDPEYKENPKMPIPLGKSVIVKKIKQTTIELTGGIIMPEAKAENSQRPNLGIIMAVGPNCTSHIRPGLRCYFNFYADLTVFIDGKEHIMMDENDVYYILKPDNFVYNAPKTEKHVIREKHIARNDSAEVRYHNKEQNEKDERIEMNKKKIKKQPKNKN